MKSALEKFYDFLNRPLFLASRPLLALLVVPLALAFTQPLWRISMTAPQYPKGLHMDIYAYKLVGGDDGQHIQEINTLNHYIGMSRIDEVATADLGWIPFALGLLMLMALRVAAVGNVRSLIDLVVATSYVTLFAFGRFVYKLYVFGHHLSPDAPVKVEPFMPVIIGTKQIANFSTQSEPMAGSILLGVFATGTAGVAIWHLVAGRRAAVRSERARVAGAADRLEAAA